MIGRIIAYTDESVVLKLEDNISLENMINYHVIFETEELKVVGEIISLSKSEATINLIGELHGNYYIPGISRKPSYGDAARLINAEEISLILGKDDLFSFPFGKVTLYHNAPLAINLNDFFTKHFAVLGSTGAGKSYALSSMIQNIFKDIPSPKNARIFLFDVYGEYHTALSNISEYNPELCFKNITTNLKDNLDIFKIPLWLLDVDDIALLLGATSPLQIPFIESALKLVNVFARNDANVIKIKNNIIASSILEILYSGRNPIQIRDQVVALLTMFNTEELNLDSQVKIPGWTRTLRQCLLIDNDGKIREIKLVTDYINTFVDKSITLDLPDGSIPYNLTQLKDAFDFALIQEGILLNNRVYDYANILKIRLKSLINSEKSKYFDYPGYINKEDYFTSLINLQGKDAQIVNFNINYVDDRFAKVMVKIISRMAFNRTTIIEPRASKPIHIFLEEAHRYVQNDIDVELIGYNIFERIAKEGRKYGCLLGLISQRPSELSETAISQCANFLILRMTHPKDLAYIKDMAPNITQEIINKLKVLQPGSCIAFGSAFKMPLTVKIDKPNPTPYSDNANLYKAWF